MNREDEEESASRTFKYLSVMVALIILIEVLGISLKGHLSPFALGVPIMLVMYFRAARHFKKKWGHFPWKEKAEQKKQNIEE
jgi:hypothetical protein